MRTRRFLYVSSILTFILLINAGNKTTTPIYACMGEQYNSIHFHSLPVDFGVPPRRATVTWRGEHDDRPTFTESYNTYSNRIGVELTPDKDDAVTQSHIKELDKLERLASEQVQHGSWKNLADTYSRIAKITGWTGSLIDRMEVLKEEKPITSQAKAVRDYLHALALDDTGKRVEAFDTFSDLACYKSGSHLIEHCWYQLGAIAYEREQNDEAIHIFQKLLNYYPATSKRPAALLMLARCYLLPAKRSSADLNRELALIPPDSYIKNGRIYLNKLIASRPPARFHKAIAGLEARIDFIRRRLAIASQKYMELRDTASIEEILYVVEKSPHHNLLLGKAEELRPWLMSQYLLKLANAQNYRQYAVALSDIDRCKSKMSIQEAKTFSLLCHSHKDLIAPYLYYRLYHVPNTPASLRSIAKLADDIVSDYNDNHLPQIIQIRIAEIHNMSREYRQAFNWANKALEQDENDRALYICGAASGKLKHYRSAVRDFQTILSRYPQSQLARGAREELAYLFEQKGELGKALDQYYAMGYSMDVAYLLDAKMTKPQIRDYFDSHRNAPQHSQIAYALGIRYMRDTDWTKAAQWLESIPKAEYQKLGKHEEYDFDEKSSPDKLTAIHDLSRLEHKIEISHTKTARADALYQYASYYYKHGTLLLYNSDLWGGYRAFHFDYYWSSNQPTPNDNRIASEYMYQHEIYARTLNICKKIATDYGDTPVAPQAMYRAACSASRLANFNGWWRKKDTSDRLYKEAVHWMHLLYTRYPNHPLAAHARKYATVFTDASKTSY